MSKVASCNETWTVAELVLKINICFVQKLEMFLDLTICINANTTCTFSDNIKNVLKTIRLIFQTDKE